MTPQTLTSNRLELVYVADVPTFELTSHGRCGVYHLAYEGQYVGAVSLTGISDGHYEIGYEIDPAFRGKGIASEAVGTVVEELGVLLMSAQARCDNLASRRVLEKTGFALASSKLVWPYGERGPLQIMAYRRLAAPQSRGVR
jgi:GNAT superfamily N-acetyltransferase